MIKDLLLGARSPTVFWKLMIAVAEKDSFFWDDNRTNTVRAVDLLARVYVVKKAYEHSPPGSADGLKKRAIKAINKRMSEAAGRQQQMERRWGNLESQGSSADQPSNRSSERRVPMIAGDAYGRTSPSRTAP